VLVAGAMMDIITSLTLSGITAAASSPDTLVANKKLIDVSRIFLMRHFLTRRHEKNDSG
jgi:hypothetical protein